MSAGEIIGPKLGPRPRHACDSNAEPLVGSRAQQFIEDRKATCGGQIGSQLLHALCIFCEESV